MHLKPLSKKLFLLLCEQLLDLMSAPLKRLKETDVLLHIQHCGADIQTRKDRQLLLRSVTLLPDGEKLIQHQARTVQRRLSIMEELILGLG